MLLLIDNYDSFTWNLVQRFGELDPAIDIRVIRNDAITPDEAEAMRPTRLVISPGPCTPKEAGVSAGMIERFRGRIPILGVCLGHQTIGEAFGADVVRADELMHGKTSRVHHSGTGVFKGLPDGFSATRYHSLTVAPDSVPDTLEVTARTEDGVIMGLQHRDRPVHGVQFHPESIASEHGHALLGNFLNSAGLKRAA